MNLREMIKRHEGLRLSSYQCPSGDWTIGWGHNLTAHGEPEQGIITLSQAEDYLEADIGQSVAGCHMVVENFDDLDEVRQAVLIDMCFNMGAGKLANFYYMLHWIRLGLWDRAAAEMEDSLWATQVTTRAKRLAQMMRTGEWEEA
jgi:lysozyme